MWRAEHAEDGGQLPADALGVGARPSDHSRTAEFVEDMTSVAASVSGPWIVLGDFNLLRFPHEKNNSNFDYARVAVFNSLINSLAWFELPLSDRSFTWSKMHDSPTLARLDRVFFNADWDAYFPDSNLASRPRTTSDHFSLLVTADTRIPASTRFFFDNSYLLVPHFLPSVLPSWGAVRARRCAAENQASRKKAL